MDVPKTFPAATLVYTQYAGKQCALPLLVDAYALFYNKKMLADAGITEPPKTMSELTAEAKKLTVRNGAPSSRSVSCRDPTTTTTPRSTSASQTGTKYYDGSGKATFATDGVGQAAGVGQGPERVVRRSSSSEFVGTSSGHSDDAKNALISGEVAMEVDGEWHVGEIADARPELRLRRRSGTGARRRREHVRRGQHGRHRRIHAVGLEAQGGGVLRPAAADDDTAFLTTLADTVFNIPSTFDSLKAWDKADDAHWAPLVEDLREPGLLLQGADPGRRRGLRDVGHLQPAVRAGQGHRPAQGAGRCSQEGRQAQRRGEGLTGQ